MLYWMCKKTGQCLTWQQMEHAVRRNFGGEEDFEPITEFEKQTKSLLTNATDVCVFILFFTYYMPAHSCLQPQS